MSLIFGNNKLGRNNIRPGIVDSDYSTFEQAIWVGTLDIGNIPPYLFDTSENTNSRPAAIDWNEAVVSSEMPYRETSSG
jgi:hypothetical protein